MEEEGREGGVHMEESRARQTKSRLVARIHHATDLSAAPDRPSLIALFSHGRSQTALPLVRVKRQQKVPDNSQRGRLADIEHLIAANPLKQPEELLLPILSLTVDFCDLPSSLTHRPALISTC